MPDREVVVVTGASAGIGRATVREFARHKARIALIAREPERLEAEQLGAQAIAIPADTSDFQALAAAADRVERELGPIDIWVNNAMVALKRMRLLDGYLARTGVSGQQGPQPIPADRPNNLWHPVPGPYAARGTFGAHAWTVSPEFWATRNRACPEHHPSKRDSHAQKRR